MRGRSPSPEIDSDPASQDQESLKAVASKQAALNKQRAQIQARMRALYAAEQRLESQAEGPLARPVAKKSVEENRSSSEPPAQKVLRPPLRKKIQV